MLSGGRAGVGWHNRRVVRIEGEPRAAGPGFDLGAHLFIFALIFFQKSQFSLIELVDQFLVTHTFTF